MATESWLWQSKVTIVANILESIINFKNFNNITAESPCMTVKYLSKARNQHGMSTDIERSQQRRQWHENHHGNDDNDEVMPDTRTEDTQLLPRRQAQQLIGCYVNKGARIQDQ